MTGRSANPQRDDLIKIRTDLSSTKTLALRPAGFADTRRVWMDVFVRVTATVAGGAQLVATAAKMAAPHTGGSHAYATETATPPLGAMFNPALPACSGGRSGRRAIRAVVVGRVTHCR